MKHYRILSVIAVLIFCFCILYFAYAWVPKSVVSDPFVRMPGTQPGQVALEAPNRCFNCHAGYDEAIEPGFNWKGSMMAQAARDPIFFACLTVAGQDSVWALGNPNAVDLCERCHFPEGWLAGRLDPPNASLMTASDYDGVHCDVCHSMFDPFFETTYNGTREGNDWVGYWDEATSLSGTQATTTYTKDVALAATIKFMSGANFYDKFNLPFYPTYTENGSGQYFMSGAGEKRASFADANAKHKMLYSRYHKSKYFCGTCHDVSNPALANLGASGLPDLSMGADQISEQYSAFRYFHVERTFSEFMLSAYGVQGGAATNPEFQALTGGINHVSKCQDCHMYDVVGVACNKNGTIFRPTGSTAHPNSGLPMHDMTGGNSWISHILASLDPTGPVYDPVNAQLLNQGPNVLTLNLTQGETPSTNGRALKAGSDRAKTQLRLAATIKDVSYSRTTGLLSFKIQNNTAHKLISGFPEGRRMFLNIKAFQNQSLIYEVNPYDSTAGTLRGLPYALSSPPLGTNEAYSDELVYETQMMSALTGEDHTFHFVLATDRYKDNRIPPKGFNIAAAGNRICIPRWHGETRTDYFTSAEYAGGYDEVQIYIAPNAQKIELNLYYQGTSREYIEFLRDEINGNATTLSSPTPSGEPNAYIIQTDPFFAKLKAWGNTIWQLWYHNHGLDGSGVAVDGIVPYRMTQTIWQGELIHDVAITDISAPSAAQSGDLVEVTVTVENLGDYQESFTVTLDDTTDSANIGSQPVVLNAGASTVLTFWWNTSGASIGIHQLTATASAVAGETETSNNTKSKMIEITSLVHDLAVTEIDAPLNVTRGDSVQISVTVENQGSVSETSTLTLMDVTDNVIIGSQPFTLGIGESQIYNFTWATQMFSVGGHILRATIDAVNGENDLSDNTMDKSITINENPNVPHITNIKYLNGAVTITFTSVNGLKYNIYYKDTLDSSWILLEQITGQDGSTQYIDDGSKSEPDPVNTMKRFYRVGM